MKKRNKKESNIDIQKLFCFTSIIFILTCIFWYGGRFIYFYLDNHKTLEETSTSKVFSTTLINSNYDSNNFKQINNTYYFTGDVSNNYVSYSNMIFRIIKINEDNTILLVTDNIVGTLAAGNDENTYQESKLINWLNDENKFVSVLNEKEKYLNLTSTCIDNITNIENITCNSINNNYYLGLLSLEDYVNTGGNNGFINNNRYSYLANKDDSNNIWYITNDGKLSTTNGSDILGIKATITLSSNTELLSGNGTIDNPYIFNNNTNLIGSYVKLDNDIWRIYEEKDNIIKLVLSSTIKDLKYNYSNKTYYHNDTINGSLAHYLNKTYYNSLSYKSIILENTYTNGLYGKENNYEYKDINTKTIETKVSIPSLDDIIFNDNLDSYFTNTGKIENEEAIYMYKESGIASTKLVTTEANIVPCISIDRNNLIVGSGTLTDPYRTE